MIPVVHLHFHRRRTGVTRHVEDVARLLPAQVTGWGLSGSVRRLTWGEVRSLAKAGPLVLHAHRNLELLVALCCGRWRARSGWCSPGTRRGRRPAGPVSSRGGPTRAS